MLRNLTRQDRRPARSLCHSPKPHCLTRLHPAPVPVWSATNRDVLGHCMNTFSTFAQCTMRQPRANFLNAKLPLDKSRGEDKKEETLPRKRSSITDRVDYFGGTNCLTFLIRARAMRCFESAIVVESGRRSRDQRDFLVLRIGIIQVSARSTLDDD